MNNTITSTAAANSVASANANSDAIVVKFRHNFSEPVMKSLYEFAKLYQYDKLSEYKEQWAKWVEANDDMIAGEEIRLIFNGFVGDVRDKMYKSGRYYFRTKINYGERKKESCARRAYVALDHQLLEHMDCHMMRLATDVRPKVCYDKFCDIYEAEIREEMTRLFDEYNMDSSCVMDKLKKTYKNRYFQNISNKV